MKRIFRRNQVIITTLAIMIAAAGYLNYSAKKEVAGSDVFEAGMMEISDEDILAENQAVNRADDGTLKEIQSLDGELESAGSLDAEAGGETQAATLREAVNRREAKQRPQALKIPGRRCSPEAPVCLST